MHPDIKDEKPRKPGRPAKEIDWQVVEKLASIQCTDEEIAAVLGVHSDTIKRRKKLPEFAEILGNGRAKGRASLRRLQWKSAEAGNVTMQIGVHPAPLRKYTLARCTPYRYSGEIGG